MTAHASCALWTGSSADGVTGHTIQVNKAIAIAPRCHQLGRSARTECVCAHCVTPRPIATAAGAISTGAATAIGIELTTIPAISSMMTAPNTTIHPVIPACQGRVKNGVGCACVICVLAPGAGLLARLTLLSIQLCAEIADPPLLLAGEALPG